MDEVRAHLTFLAFLLQVQSKAKNISLKIGMKPETLVLDHDLIYSRNQRVWA